MNQFKLRDKVTVFDDPEVFKVEHISEDRVYLRDSSGWLTFARQHWLRKAIKYREPVLPADYGKQVEVSDNEKRWRTYELVGYHRKLWRTESSLSWKHARIQEEQ